MFRKTLLLFHTVKYLRAIQIYSRIKLFFFKNTPNVYSPPDISESIHKFIYPVFKKNIIINGDKFTFLNKQAVISSAYDWNSIELDKLWLYNLHYFDYIINSDIENTKKSSIGIINRWISENLPYAGNGWEPYPLSIRIVNWIKYFVLADNFEDNWVDSLATQTRFLSRNIETHLLGNHIFANSKALIFAGLFFKGKEAEYWYKQGIRILSAEISEQILEDGGNFELSPMYHAIILEDLLDLVNIHRSFDVNTPSGIEEKISPMFKWLEVMCHPDGDVSFFNDSVKNFASSLEDLISYAERLNISINNDIGDVTILKESGYVRVQKNDLVALLDVAHVGPDYIPGHAHADTLSIELSLFNERVMVNSGVSCYGESKERLRQRGTASHNTVIINDENSSEVWGGFRVARRAKPFNFNLNVVDSSVNIGCSHDGYMRLKGGPVHSRNWTIKPDEIIIKDFIIGEFMKAEARFHFHPNINLELDNKCNNGTIILKGGKYIYFEVHSGRAELMKSTYHPEFGILIDNICLSLTFVSPQSEIRFYWQE